MKKLKDRTALVVVLTVIFGTIGLLAGGLLALMGWKVSLVVIVVILLGTCFGHIMELLQSAPKRNESFREAVRRIWG